MAGQKISTELFELELRIAPDKLKAFAAATPKGRPVNRTDLIAALTSVLREAQLELGVLDDIARRLTLGQKVSERLIAKGIPPTEGAPGRLVTLIKPFTGKAEMLAEKTPDFRSAIHLFDNVVKGQALARVFPPTAGVPGVSVTGDSLPCVVQKPVKVSFDKTIVLEQRSGEHAGDYLVALLDGYVTKDGERFAIKEELKLPYDVDLYTGNIDFVGTVAVQGNVAPGFAVRGKKGVTIRGDARQCILESADGDVSVQGFLFGGEQAQQGTAASRVLGRIVARGNVSIRNAQEISIDAGGDITVEKHAVDCVLRSYRSITAPSARVLGGETLAVCGLEVLELGNEAGKRTIVHLCNTAEATPEYAALDAQRLRLEQAIQLIELHLGPYAKNPARIALLHQPFRGKMEGLRDKLEQLHTAHRDILKRREKLLSSATMTAEPRANVRGMLFPGSEIRCQGEVFSPKEPIAGPISVDFVTDSRKFVVGPLQALTCSIAPTTSTTNSPSKVKNQSRS